MPPQLSFRKTHSSHFAVFTVQTDQTARLQACAGLHAHTNTDHIQKTDTLCEPLWAFFVVCVRTLGLAVLRGCARKTRIAQKLYIRADFPNIFGFG